MRHVYYKDLGKKIDYLKINDGILKYNSGENEVILILEKGKWKKGKCSECGIEGTYFDGGKKEEHFCIKCNPRIKN